LDLLAHLDALVDVTSDSLEVVLAHSSAGHCWSTDTDTARSQSRLVSWSGVLVACNVDLLENGLHSGTVKGLGLQVEQDHVVVGTVGDKFVTAGLELVLEGLGVLDDLLLVLSEIRGLSLLERDGQSGDGMIVWTTLVTWEDGEIDWSLEIVQCLKLLASLHLGLSYALPEEDHGSTRAAQTLVGGSGDDIGVWEWRVVDLAGDQTRNVGHVDNQVAADLVCNLSHARIVDGTAVSRGTSDDDLGSVHEGILLELLVVDDASLEVDAVWEGLEVGGNGRDPTYISHAIKHKMAI